MQDGIFYFILHHVTQFCLSSKVREAVDLSDTTLEVKVTILEALKAILIYSFRQSILTIDLTNNSTYFCSRHSLVESENIAVPGSNKCLFQ